MIIVVETTPVAGDHPNPCNPAKLQPSTDPALPYEPNWRLVSARANRHSTSETSVATPRVGGGFSLVVHVAVGERIVLPVRYRFRFRLSAVRKLQNTTHEGEHYYIFLYISIFFYFLFIYTTYKKLIIPQYYLNYFLLFKANLFSLIILNCWKILNI